MCVLENVISYKRLCHFLKMRTLYLFYYDQKVFTILIMFVLEKHSVHIKNCIIA